MFSTGAMGIVSMYKLVVYLCGLVPDAASNSPASSAPITDMSVCVASSDWSVAFRRPPISVRLVGSLGLNAERSSLRVVSGPRERLCGRT